MLYTLVAVTPTFHPSPPPKITPGKAEVGGVKVCVDVKVTGAAPALVSGIATKEVARSSITRERRIRPHLVDISH